MNKLISEYLYRYLYFSFYSFVKFILRKGKNFINNFKLNKIEKNKKILDLI